MSTNVPPEVQDGGERTAPTDAEPKAKPADASNRAQHFYRETITQLVRKTDELSGFQMREKTTSLLNSMLRGLVLKLASMTQAATVASAQRMINPGDFEMLMATALDGCGNLRGACLAFIQDALRQFSANTQLQKDRKEELHEAAAAAGGAAGKQKPVRMHTKAGLTLGISVGTPFIEVVTNLSVNKAYRVAVTAVLEFLLRELLTAAAESCTAAKPARVQIAPWHLRLGLLNHPELAKALEIFGVTLAIGGATPYLDPRILANRDRTARRRQRARTGPPRAHRYRPGTVALRLIRHLQDGSRLLQISQQGMRGLVSQIVDNELLPEVGAFMRTRRDGAGSRGADDSVRVRYEESFHHDLQCLVEQEVICLLREALRLLLDSGRKTMTRDVVVHIARTRGYDLASCAADGGDPEEAVSDDEDDEAEAERLEAQNSQAGGGTDAPEDSVHEVPPCEEEGDEEGAARGGKYRDSIRATTCKRFLQGAGSKRNGAGAIAATDALARAVLRRYLRDGLNGLSNRKASTMSVGDVAAGAFALRGQVLAFPSERTHVV